MTPEKFTDTKKPTQKINEGYGPAFHRVYSIKIKAKRDAMTDAMKLLQSAPGEFSPQHIARFEKTKGRTGTLQPGDEFNIHITGPWNGPVRVDSVDDSEFSLKTLHGHMEAGEIFFRLRLNHKSPHVFEIESLARSRDRVVDFLYDTLEIAKAAQTEMWTLFCKNFAKCVLGLPNEDKFEIAEVTIMTERFDSETKKWITI